MNIYIYVIIREGKFNESAQLRPIVATHGITSSDQHRGSNRIDLQPPETADVRSLTEYLRQARIDANGRKTVSIECLIFNSEYLSDKYKEAAVLQMELDLLGIANRCGLSDEKIKDLADILKRGLESQIALLRTMAKDESVFTDSVYIELRQAYKDRIHQEIAEVFSEKDSMNILRSKNEIELIDSMDGIGNFLTAIQYSISPDQMTAVISVAKRSYLLDIREYYSATDPLETIEMNNEALKEVLNSENFEMWQLFTDSRIFQLERSRSYFK